MNQPLTHLNKFFELAEKKKLSANAQLIYLHLFNLFNRAHWAETLKLTDKELQAKIKFRSGKKHLTPLEAIRNAKSQLKLKGFVTFKNKRRAEGTEYRLLPLTDDVEVDEEQHEEPKPAQEQLSVNSEAVLKAWDECDGATLKGGLAFMLINLENAYGTDFLVETIYEAGKANSYPRLSYNFLVAVLENRLKGKNRNERHRSNSVGRGTEQYAGIVDDEVPPEYRHYCTPRAGNADG